MNHFRCTLAALAAALSFFATMPALAYPDFDPSGGPWTDPCPAWDGGDIITPGQDTT